MTRRFTLAICFLCLPLAAAAQQGDDGRQAVAEIRNQGGKVLGSMRFLPTPNGVIIEGAARRHLLDRES